MITCAQCPKRSVCTQLCDDVTKKIRGGGKNRKRKTYPVDFQTFEARSTAELNRFQIESLNAVSYWPTERLELRILVEQVLSFLSIGQRFVFVKKMEGYTNQEIAGLTGLSEKAIEQRHTRARKRLKTVLAQLNGDL